MMGGKGTCPLSSLYPFGLVVRGSPAQGSHVLSVMQCFPEAAYPTPCTFSRPSGAVNVPKFVPPKYYL